jgi:hypothetical protein
MGSPLNCERLRFNISGDNGARFQNYLSAVNWALDSSIHNDPFSSNSAFDPRFWGHNERGAVQVAIDLPIDFNQTLSRHATYNFESFGYHRPFMSCEHDFLPRKTDHLDPCT